MLGPTYSLLLACTVWYHEVFNTMLLILKIMWKERVHVKTARKQEKGGACEDHEKRGSTHAKCIECTTRGGHSLFCKTFTALSKLHVYSTSCCASYASPRTFFSCALTLVTTLEENKSNTWTHPAADTTNAKHPLL